MKPPKVRALKKGERLLYHVFADQIDDFFYAHEFERANKRYEKLIEDHQNVRLYWEIEIEETGDTVTEDCIRSQGEYPQ